VTETIGTLFQRCLDSQGESFREAETAILRLGLAALPFLRAQVQTNPDPVARQTAVVLFQQIAGSREIFRGALSYLDNAEARHAGSPQAGPRSDMIAATLRQRFGSRPAAYLALYLQKNPDWPEWKVASVTHYLSLVKAPRALPAVVRFTAQNTREHYAHLVKLAHASYSPEAIAKAQQDEQQFQSRSKSG